jgi:serine/threonine protein kinase
VEIYKELKHPNIIEFHEAFLNQENLCIVMEYMEGFNLLELIKINNEKVKISPYSLLI